MSEMMMPCSYEAEQAVLGGLMLDNDRWDEVILPPCQGSCRL